MNIQSAKSRKTPTSAVAVPHDLIAEVLSFLPVKSLLQFRCVSKSWKTLISDSAFVKLHLNRSSTQNPQFTLITDHITYHFPCDGDGDGDANDYDDDYDSFIEFDCCVIPYSMRCLIQNPSFSFSIDPYYSLNGNKDNKDCSRIVGTCNGLICLYGYSFVGKYQEYWFRLWNLASRQTSPKFGYFRTVRGHGTYKFKFGCDNSSGTYKLLAFREKNNQPKSSVRILSCLSDDAVWRGVESFPALPLWSVNAVFDVHCSGALNWLAIHGDFCYYNSEETTLEQLVIVSLDLGTETYNQYKLPCGFIELPPAAPTVGVLGGYLCFSYSYRHTYFVIWQMKKFGAEDSWTQFLKISYQNLQVKYDLAPSFQLVPVLLFEDADTLILSSHQENGAILYNWRDNKVRRTNITASKPITNNCRTSNQVCWSSTSNYIESLVSIF